MPEKPTEINVIPSSEELKYDYSRSLDELQSEETDTINPFDFNGVSTTQGYAAQKIGYNVKVNIDHKTFPKYKAICLWYDTVDITFTIDPTIVIAKEVYEDRCMHEEVLAHEMKHVRASREVVNKYSKIIGKKVYEGLKERGFYTEPMKVEYAKDIMERMQKTVFQIVEHEYKKLDLEHIEAQQAIDSLEEYQTVGAQCKEFKAKRAALSQKKH